MLPRCKNAEESTSFGEDIVNYKIMDKAFAFFLLNPKEAEYFVVLKCEPEKTVELREKYRGIKYNPQNQKSKFENPNV